MTHHVSESGPRGKRTLECVQSPTASRVLAFVFVCLLLFMAARTAQAQTLNVLHNFAAGKSDGAYASGNLLLDAQGNLYGTTLNGGARRRGVVFEFTSNGTYKLLYSFTGKADGISPQGSLVQDGQGNLYGVTFEGGAKHYGTIFKLAPSGALTVLYSFSGAPDAGLPLGGLALDAQGNVYGTTIEGGATSSICPIGCGTVFQVAPDGTEKLLYSFQGGTGDGNYPLWGLVRDTHGNLYGTTNQGGAQDGGILFAVTPSGSEKVLHDFQANGQPGDGAIPGGGLIRDAHGNFYGTTIAGGTFGRGTVFEVAKSGAETVLYSFGGKHDVFAVDHGLVRDAHGNLYGASSYGGAFNYGAVFEVNADGTEKILYSFTGGADGRRPGAGLVLDAQGNLYGTTVHGGAFNYGTLFKLTP